MPDFASVLREEIRRLARSEIRNETAVLKKSSAQYRREIAALKRDLVVASRKIAVLETQQKRERTKNIGDMSLGGRRFSAKGLRTHRKKLGFSAAEYGELIGVTGKSIYLWEQGKVKPRGKTFAALIEIRELGKRAALARLNK